MMPTRAGGSRAYVAAHRISVVEQRLPFEQAYCLALLVFDHSGRPFVPERKGHISLKLCRELAAQDLVMLTGEMRDIARAIVRLTVSAALLDELPGLPDQTVTVQSYDEPGRRKKVNWFVEVTQDGLDMVASVLDGSG